MLRSMAAACFTVAAAACMAQGPQVGGLTAVHRSGQTFLTWDEVAALGGESYRIYRHTAPIDALSLTSAVRVAQIAEGSAYHAREGANFIIENLGSPLASGRGLFVHTTRGTGVVHYAVTVVTNGVENVAAFGAGNSLAAGVAEQEADPAPVLIRTSGRTKVFTQFMDYAGWNPTLNGYAYNYAVSTASDVTTNVPSPLFLRLHEYGNRYAVDSQPTWGRGIEISVDDPNNTWHYGFSGTWNYAAGGTPATGPIVNFTELRHLRAVYDVCRDPAYNVDTNRIYVFGSSMGGSGSLSMGLRYPQVFAAAFCWLPMTDYRSAADANWAWDMVPRWGTTAVNLPVENRGRWAAPLAAANGLGVYDWMNHATQVVRRAGQPAAYLFFHHGTADATIAWPQQGSGLPLAAYLGRLGFHAMVDGSAHVGLGFLDPVTNATPNWHPKLADFRKDRSFPAFGWSDANGPLPPVATSRYNFGLEWSCASNNFAGEIVDSPTQYVIAVRAIGTDQRTTVTPRRLQSFPVSAGRRFLWRNQPLGTATNLQAGVVFADADGLVTVTNFMAATAGSRLVLDADRPDDADGDGVPDYWEQAFGFSPTNSADGGAWDFDGDGSGAATEYAAGTDPRDAQSVLRVCAFDGAALEWQSRPGFRYQLAGSTSFPSWTALGGVVTAATDRATGYPDAAAGSPFRMFRVEVLR